MTDSNRRRFGFYIELCGPGWDRRQSALGVTGETRQELQREFGSRLIAMGTTREAIVAELGSPDQDTLRASRYDLGIRAGYLFEFKWSETGTRLVDSGYARSIERKLLIEERPSNPAQVMSTQRYVQSVGATADELVAVLGEPIDRSGWWPIETWSYPDSLTLELRLGVVEGPGQ